MNCPFGQSMVDEVLAAGTAGTFSGTIIWAGGGEGWVLELKGVGGTTLLNPALVRRLREALAQRVDEARRTGTQIPAGLAQLDGHLPRWERQLTAKLEARAMDPRIKAAFA